MIHGNDSEANTTNMPIQANVSNEEILLHLNNEIARTLIPAMLVVGLLMLIGLFGNGLVCFVFGTRLKPGTQNFTILCLAVFDLLSCLIAMPTEIVDMRYYYLFDSEFACKLFRFVNVLCTFCSILTLLVIAIDRYIKVCRPLGRQMTPREAKIAVLVSVLVGVLFAWPTLFIYGARTADTGIPGIEGTDCSTSDDVKDTAYPLAYNCLLFFLFIGLTTTFLVLYCRIYREVQRHKKYMTKVAISTPSSPMSSMVEFNYPSTASEGPDELPIRKSVTKAASLLRLNLLPRENGSASVSSSQQNVSSSPNSEKDTDNSNGDISGSCDKDDGQKENKGRRERMVSFKMENGSDSTLSNGNSQIYVNEVLETDHRAGEGVDGATDSPRSKVRHIPPPLQLTNVNDGCESDIGSGISSCSTPRYKRNARLSIGRETRTTVIAFLVTTVFVISYLPYLGLTFARIFNKDFDHDIRGSALAAYNLFLRSYFVNSASNPIIYGFLNYRFRQEVKSTFKKLRFWKRV